MPVRDIIRFPDPRLRRGAEPVSVFDDALAQLIADLHDTLHAAAGIGLTAPHIGVGLRVVVLAPAPQASARTYINPQIIWSSPERVRSTEGSLSMPGVFADVERAARVRISYQDPSGQDRSEDAEGLAAICHQHELDQLDGVFWLLRLSRLKRDRLIRRYEKSRPD